MSLIPLTIASVTGTPREGRLVTLVAEATVEGLTDAGGGVTLAVAPGESYRLALTDALVIDGVAYPAGAVLVLMAPGGSDTVTLADCIVEVIDASPIALLDRIAALEAWRATVEAGGA